MTEQQTTPVDPYALAPGSHGAAAEGNLRASTVGRVATPTLVAAAQAQATLQVAHEIRALRMTVEMVGDRLVEQLGLASHGLGDVIKREATDNSEAIEEAGKAITASIEHRVGELDATVHNQLQRLTP